VNTELTNSNSKNPKEQSLDQRLANNPRLRQRFLAIADMVDQAVQEGCTADEAEERAIQEIRKLGQEILTEWAEKSAPQASQKAQKQDARLIKSGKKNS
jgi:hypothetical protein